MLALNAQDGVLVHRHDRSIGCHASREILNIIKALCNGSIQSKHRTEPVSLGSELISVTNTAMSIEGMRFRHLSSTMQQGCKYVGYRNSISVT